jgi:hypothetical protein
MIGVLYNVASMISGLFGAYNYYIQKEEERKKH